MDKRRRAANVDYRVRLTCGCSVPTRLPPQRYTARFMCTSGLGHGYRLLWVSCDGPAGWRAVNPEA
jgi:hypothetical protein